MNDLYSLPTFLEPKVAKMASCIKDEEYRAKVLSMADECLELNPTRLTFRECTDVYVGLLKQWDAWMAEQDKKRTKMNDWYWTMYWIMQAQGKEIHVIPPDF